MSSPITPITDFQQRLRDDMLSQFFGDPVHTAISDAVALEIQRVMAVMADMLNLRLLANATGGLLDTIGAIVRVQRLGRTDDDYRRIIQVEIAVRNSDGGAEQIMWIAGQLVNAEVRYTQLGTLNYLLEYESDTALSDELQAEAVDMITRATAAGVSWRMVMCGSTTSARYDADTYGAGEYGAVIGGS